MSRPPRVEKNVLVDAHSLAYAGGSIEHRFRVAQLPRLTDAGIVEPADIGIAIHGTIVEGRVALDGELTGFVTTTCQRCMRPVRVEVNDRFQLVLVSDEAARIAEERRATGYEPIVAEPTRLNLSWVAEEQTLLGMPLVPKHEDERCASGREIIGPAAQETDTHQRPFADLKRLLQGRC